MSSLQDILKKHKITLLPEFNKGFIRAGAQWFTGKEAEVGGRLVQWAAFGDFARSLSEHWNNLGGKLTSEEQERINAFIKEAHAENRKAREEHWETVRFEVEKEWAGFSDLGTAPYLDRKGLGNGGLYGCRVEPFEKGARLIVPARDVHGKIWGFQRVYSEKLSQTGTDKIFRTGARKEGCFHVLGELRGASCVYVCEGIATAISIYEAFERQRPVVSCYDAGNLGYVAKALRGAYPDTHFCFCADNDCWPAKDGRIYHTGRVKAEAAAKAVGNAHVVLPVFQSNVHEKRPTDFDDLRILSGLQAVKEQILNPAPSPRQAKGGPETPLGPTASEQEVAKKPKITETAIAERVLKSFGDDLIRQDKSLFQYTGTHWVELDSYDIDQIKNEINNSCSKALDSKKVNSIYATFFRMVPHVPKGVNLFTPNPKCGNFLDGTLRLNRDETTGIYCLSFSEHKREDYLTWVIPIKYNCDRAVKNRRWEQLLEEALEGESDKEGILRALKQMGGAMLVPTFPQMFFLHGVSGSRKSTIVLTLAKLIAEQNISKVDPANMENFQLEGMIGKLVNMKTDIDDHIALPRGFLKNFEDDTSMQVNRKGKPVVNSKLPAVHIYCANDLPPNFESGKAFSRRATLLHFKNDLTHGHRAQKVIRRYEELIWAEGYEGLLNWMLEGLSDLVGSGGKFFSPESSETSLKEWQEENDPLAQFIDALVNKEVDGNAQYFVAPGAVITRKNLWIAFESWQSENRGKAAPWNNARLAKALRKWGATEKTIQGVRHWVGLGLKVSEESDV